MADLATTAPERFGCHVQQQFVAAGEPDFSGTACQKRCVDGHSVAGEISSWQPNDDTSCGGAAAAVGHVGVHAMQPTLSAPIRALVDQ